MGDDQPDCAREDLRAIVVMDNVPAPFHHSTEHDLDAVASVGSTLCVPDRPTARPAARNARLKSSVQQSFGEPVGVVCTFGEQLAPTKNVLVIVLLNLMWLNYIDPSGVH